MKELQEKMDEKKKQIKDMDKKWMESTWKLKFANVRKEGEEQRLNEMLNEDNSMGECSGAQTNISNQNDIGNTKL